MLKSQGYPDVKGALAMVAKHLGVPGRTLSRWFNGENNPPPDINVQEKTVDMLVAIQSELAAIMKDMPAARADATYSQLGTVFGILFDKRRLLEGLPTEIFSLMPDWLAALDRRGLKATDVIRTMTARLNNETPNGDQVQ